MITLVADLDVRIVHAITGKLLRELTIYTTRDYQPQKRQQAGPCGSGLLLMSCDITWRGVDTTA
ncbi:hypothetical protein [Cellulomonas wangleii]|uniref:hypothetical protein n=1 Tax=Cellulomonas wangleii TaxID=2816956 RepID=UPI001FB1C36A|nr:hypothetical protein [Cellulomonas wangleii]